MTTEPRAGRRVTVTDRRTAPDFAAQMKYLCDELCPDADGIRAVPGNPNTHAFGSPFATYPPDGAWRLRRKLESHYTPKYASWLNAAECELSAPARQCPNRRPASKDGLAAEVKARVTDRNAAGVKVTRAFRVADARRKLATCTHNLPSGEALGRFPSRCRGW